MKYPLPAHLPYDSILPYIPRPCAGLVELNQRERGIRETREVHSVPVAKRQRSLVASQIPHVQGRAVGHRAAEVGRVTV